MVTEQINLATVKELIDSAKHLKSQLDLMNAKLETLTKERDLLTQKVNSQDSDFSREKSNLNIRHSTEMQSLRDTLKEEIDTLSENSKTELQTTIQTYEDKMKQVTDELTKKNNSLLKELQDIKQSHQALINRIRGLSS